jgi:hypothetical protein
VVKPTAVLTDSAKAILQVRPISTNWSKSARDATRLQQSKRISALLARARIAAEFAQRLIMSQRQRLADFRPTVSACGCPDIQQRRMSSRGRSTPQSVQVTSEEPTALAARPGRWVERASFANGSMLTVTDIMAASAADNRSPALANGGGYLAQRRQPSHLVDVTSRTDRSHHEGDLRRASSPLEESLVADADDWACAAAGSGPGQPTAASAVFSPGAAVAMVSTELAAAPVVAVFRTALGAEL